MPLISLIVAMTRDHVIGKDNDLPWKLSADLKRFKQLTVGKPVVMGRKTWESIGRPLPDRTNIIVTRQEAFEAPGCQVVHSLDEAIAAAGEVPEIMIIGGAQLYRDGLYKAERLYVTWVEATIDGDTRFPELDLTRWRVREETTFAADEKNAHPTTFQILDRLDGWDNFIGGTLPCGT